MTPEQYEVWKREQELVEREKKENLEEQAKGEVKRCSPGDPPRIGRGGGSATRPALCLPMSIQGDSEGQ